VGIGGGAKAVGRAPAVAASMVVGAFRWERKGGQAAVAEEERMGRRVVSARRRIDGELGRGRGRVGEKRRDGGSAVGEGKWGG
jgi:hypothetical protein